MPKLVLPNTKYRKAFIRDFLPYMFSSRVKYSLDNYNEISIKKDFRGFVRMLKGQRVGKRLPVGFVPQTVYWLIDGTQMLGWISLRHSLTPELKKWGGHIGYEVTAKYRGQGYGKLLLKEGLKKEKKWE